MNRSLTSGLQALVAALLVVVLTGSAFSQVLLEENFDSYNPGDFPTGWILSHPGEGVQYQVVTDEEYYSAPNSFTMLGKPNNSAVAKYEFTSPPSRIAYRARVRVREGSVTASIAGVSLWNPSEGNWYYCRLRFDDTCIFINASTVPATVLMLYERNRWYDVVVNYDGVAKTASVWIDGELKGDNIPLPTGTQGYTALTLSSEHGGVQCYFDDVLVMDYSNCWKGLSFSQIDWVFDTTVFENTAWGQVLINVAAITDETGLPSGYLNIYTDLGWKVMNLPFDTADGLDFMVADFPLMETDGTDVPVLSAHVEFTADPQTSFSDGAREEYPVSRSWYSAEGIGSLRAPSVPPANTGVTNPITYNPNGATDKFLQPNRPNQQAAHGQCIPMAIANSMQYLEGRFGLNVEHDHNAGLRGDNTLVGMLDSLTNRAVTNRRNGSGVWFRPMMNGKFRYLKDYGLGRKIINRHQGYGYGTAAQQLPPGDYSANGVTSKDEGGKVTFEWIEQQIKNGEDVELVWSVDGAGGAIQSGHAVRIVGIGHIKGVPVIYYLDDPRQTNIDHTDASSLNQARPVHVSDLDGDGTLNLGQNSNAFEIRFAWSESADNDLDSIPDGLDNAPLHYNPWQDDMNFDGIGDVIESPWRQDEEISIFDLPGPGAWHSSDMYENDIPFFPIHKDIWFVGTAFNPNPADTAWVAISFSYREDGGEVMWSTVKDTTIIPPNTERQVHGSLQLPDCPDSVAVHFESIGGSVVDVSGTLSHLCYPLEFICCVESRGNVVLQTGPDWCNPPDGQTVDITDLTNMIDHMFINYTPICCLYEADIAPLIYGGEPDFIVDIADLTAMIDHLFINYPALPPCQ